jgi:hypothetical protein
VNGNEKEGSLGHDETYILASKRRYDNFIIVFVSHFKKIKIGIDVTSLQYLLVKNFQFPFILPRIEPLLLDKERKKGTIGTQVYNRCQKKLKYV